jgi:hypothetical protein
VDEDQPTPGQRLAMVGCAFAATAVFVVVVVILVALVFR